MALEHGSAAELRGFSPEVVLAGSLRPPGSKSIAQRALLCAGLAEGTTTLAGVPSGDDVDACVTSVRALGAEVRTGADSEVVIVGVGARGISTGAVLDVGESGTLARFATAVLALNGGGGARARILARGSLARRHSAPLVETLTRAGAELAPESEAGTWPLSIRAREEGRPADELALKDPVSSQELSALWIASATSAREVRIEVTGSIPSEPYLALTRRVLIRFGVEVKGASRSGSSTVRGPLRAPAQPFTIEPDASSAAVALAAGCLSGGEVRVPALHADSLQGDVRIVEYLARFGCDAGSDENGLRARGEPSRGAEIDLEGEPDLAPVLAIVAASAALRHGATSVLGGLSALRRKESDRLGGLARGLERAGWESSVQGDALLIRPPASAHTDALVLDSNGDHRMAFAWALLGLVRGGVRVSDPECVAKSWPSFWDQIGELDGGSDHSVRAERTASRPD